MTIRVCDRCSVPVQPAASAVAVTLPIDDPATKQKAVTGDFLATLILALQPTPAATVDLCPICLASAIAELMIATLIGAGLSAAQSRKLQTRINAAIPLLIVPDAVIV